MNTQMKEYIEQILHDMESASYIKSDEIPAIELYMDQVTTFMDKHLASSKRYEDDKILTKTMINNYAKNDLLPPPIKKKYSKNHILMMIFIYYFKGFLSINDIQNLLTPLTEQHFGENAELSLSELYTEISRLEKKQLDNLGDDVLSKLELAQSSFEDADYSDKDFLQFFSMICMLSFDVYMKKQIIERMIDNLLPSVSPHAATNIPKDKAEAKAAKKAAEKNPKKDIT